MAAQGAVERAIEIWQPFYRDTLSQSEGEEIVETMTAYLNILAEWLVMIDNPQTDQQGV